MNPLIPDPGLLFWMVLSFGVVFFLLAKFGFPVITKAINERKEFIEMSLLSAKEANERLANIQAESEKLLSDAKAQQKDIITGAMQEKQRIVQAAQEEAQNSANQMKQLSQQIIAQEVKEVEVEESSGKGHLNLSKHQRKPRTHKKCWICRSPNHLKRSCPKIKCFYCHKLGHVKAKCREMKIDFIFKRLTETYQKKKKIDQKKQKEDEKLLIFKKRAFQSKYINKEDKIVLQWNNADIGEYIGPGIPKPFKDFQKDSFRWKQLDANLKHNTAARKLKLIDGLSNICGCGKADLDKYDFIKHIRESHRGVAPSSSQLNRPPWLDWILYYDDDVELLYCYVDDDK